MRWPRSTDTMDYDDLNRLTEVVISNPSFPLNVTKTVAYDAIGNITNKSDVGDYTLHNGRGGDGGPQDLRRHQPDSLLP